LEGVDVEDLSLSDTDRIEVARDPNTEAIAAVMPMKLIQPLQTKDAQPTAGPTWGVGAVRAADSPFDGSQITVAVLDTGIDPNHEAFTGVDLIRENFTEETDDDTHGHGTHCAGTIFGQDVGGQRIGVARNVESAVIGKVLGAGGGSSATIAKAVQWAVNKGAHVISMSLGIDFPGFVEFLIKERDMDINPATSLALAEYRHNINLFSALARMVRAQGAFGQGTVIVAASGNESRRPQYQIAVAPPAAGEDIAAIGALQQSADGLTVAGFSNTEVDVSAPGVDVVSARAGGGLASMSGTSMATPHVAGVAALWAQKMLAVRGNVDSAALTAQIVGRASTAPLAAGFDSDDVGAGIVQAPLS
jgi:subtilisin family serine protease